MRHTTKDPDGYEPGDVVIRLRYCIDHGTRGIDYTILPRPENETFFQKYVISDDERIAIRRRLTSEDYEGWDYSKNADHPDDIVHVFKTQAMLFPRGKEDAEQEVVILYIKLTWGKPEGVMIVISFHD